MDVQLVVVKGNPRGRTLTFGPGDYLFGRGAECHVRPDSEWVSRQHCLLSVKAETIQLKDLGSTNGTLVNGQRLMGERDLVDGDTIQVGPMSLQVRMAPHDGILDANHETSPPSNEPTLVDEGAGPLLKTVKFPSNNKSE